MKVVITGGGGFIGRRLARSLLDRGALTGADGRAAQIDRLVIFDVAAPQPPLADDPRLEVATGDIGDPETVNALVTEGGGAVFHLAAVVSAGAEEDFDLGMSVNMTGTMNVLDACRRHGTCPRVIFASSVAVFGGVPYAKQEKAFRDQVDVVVACPGRLLDLYGEGIVDFSKIEVLVLDEADHMFDMGFLPDIRRILAELPKERQNLLFSATMPREIRHLADEVLHDPHVVDLAGRGPAETIEHALYPVPEERKRDLLEHILESGGCHSAIVFTRTKHRARRLAQQLDKSGYRAIGLQGNMSQAQRDRAMRGFRSRRFDILVATDIAARGIDVSGVSHVINYDVPNTPEAYTHRIGRTGRSELDGKACTFVTQEDWSWVRATERMIAEPIPRRQVESFTEEEVASNTRPARPRNGRGRDDKRGRSRPSNGRRRGARSRNASRPAAR